MSKDYRVNDDRKVSPYKPRVGAGVKKSNKETYCYAIYLDGQFMQYVNALSSKSALEMAKENNWAKSGDIYAQKVAKNK